MQSIILIGDEKLDMSLVRNIQHQGSIKSYNVEDNYVVEFPNGHLRYVLLPDLISEYDSEELSRIPFNNPRFISLEYTSIDLVKRALCQESILDSIWVDNDNGKITLIEDFRTQIS